MVTITPRGVFIILADEILADEAAGRPGAPGREDPVAGDVGPLGMAAAIVSVRDVLIAEMLLLVAVNDKGHVPAGGDAFMKVGLSGALLAELAIDGRLTIAADGTVQAGDTRPGDDLLADVYDAVRERLAGRKAGQVVRGLDRRIGGSWNRVVDRLVGTGVLGREKPSVFRPTQHPVLDTAGRQVILDQVRAAATGDGPVNADVAVVLALAGPCRLLERIAPDRRTRGEAKKRIARATAGTAFAPDVAKIIDEVIAAVAVTATTVAAPLRCRGPVSTL